MVLSLHPATVKKKKKNIKDRKKTKHHRETCWLLGNKCQPLSSSCAKLIISHKETQAPATEKMSYQSQLQVIISVSLSELFHPYLFHNQETEREASAKQPNGQSNLNSICKTKSKEIFSIRNKKAKE
jgi:hypothetical protein